MRWGSQGHQKSEAAAETSGYPKQCLRLAAARKNQRCSFCHSLHIQQTCEMQVQYLPSLFSFVQVRAAE